MSSTCEYAELFVSLTKHRLLIVEWVDQTILTKLNNGMKRLCSLLCVRYTMFDKGTPGKGRHAFQN